MNFIARMAAALSCMAYAAASHRLMYGVVPPHLIASSTLSTSSSHALAASSSASLRAAASLASAASARDSAACARTLSFGCPARPS